MATATKALAGLAGALLVAAGVVATVAVHDRPSPAAELRAYVAEVEAVRLPVNQLLEGADPILGALHDHTITPAVASARMDALERRFAGYAAAANAIAPANGRLAALNRPYATTYLLEDSYLATLASDLVDGDFENLPATQGAQRLAIITWRVGLELVARQHHVVLPADIEQAGRGEIAPSPGGS